MATEHFRRDEPAFYNSLALDRTRLDAPDVLGGLTGALMSKDFKSDAHTFIVEIPAGWRAKTDAQLASLEFFLLRGDLALNGESVGSSGYIHVPQACGGGELTSKTGAVAYAFWNPNIPAYAYPVTRNRTINALDKGWSNSLPGHCTGSVMHKSMRLPDPAPHPDEEGFDGGPGGFIKLMYIAPNVVAEAEHVHHECFEEIILLHGDVLLLNEGQMAPGSVVCHPQEWYHAPFVTRGGALILVHTDGPMGYPWPPRDYPHGHDLCKQYVETLPFDTPVQHIPWDQHPLAKVQEESPEYQAWRKTPEGQKWGGYEPLANVPYRPGGRGTQSEYRGSWTRKGDTPAILKK